MSKISTMQKLFGLSLLLSLFTVGVGAFSVKELSNISDDVDELYSVHMRGLDIAKSINISVLRIVREEKNLIISTTDEENRKQLKSLAEEYTILDSYLKEIQKYFVSAEGQLSLSKMFAVIKEWREVHNKTVELGKTTDPAMNAKAQEISLTAGREKTQNLATTIQDVVDTKIAYAQKVSLQSKADFILARNITVGGVVLSLLLGIGLGYLLARNMLRQLGDEPASLAALALRIAGGDLNAQFNPSRTEIGVFGAMKQMVATLKGKIAEADQKSRKPGKNLNAPDRPPLRRKLHGSRRSEPRLRACCRRPGSSRALLK